MACNCATCRSHRSDDARNHSGSGYAYRSPISEALENYSTADAFREREERIRWENAGRPPDTTDDF
jgi:hypothetical protein